MKEVTGRRSPRWAALSKMVIHNRHGEAYLVRWRLVDTPLFGLYVHHITAPDPQEDPHDHPWNFTSVVLKGWYVEAIHRIVPDFNARGSRAHFSGVNRWRLGSVHRMQSGGVAHRIVQHAPSTWTLILRGKRTREWGFWTPAGFCHWKEYEE